MFNMDTQGQVMPLCQNSCSNTSQKATIELVSGPYIDDAGRLWLIKYILKVF